MLLDQLTKQEPGQDRDEGIWNLSMAAGTCLGLVAQCVKDEIVSLVMPYVQVRRMLPLAAAFAHIITSYNYTAAAVVHRRAAAAVMQWKPSAGSCLLSKHVLQAAGHIITVRLCSNAISVVLCSQTLRRKTIKRTGGIGKQPPLLSAPYLRALAMHLWLP